MSVMVDLKRRSPTIPSKRIIAEFRSAGSFCSQLAKINVDAFLVNMDETEYGGKFEELKECADATRLLRPANPPACIAKDIIIHPVQIAQALQQGASGVLLIMAVVGGDLEVLLDACTIMGTEAIVEVHTPNELEFALSKGATIFLVNMWDRMSGRLFKEQAKGLASMMPMNSVAVAAGDIMSMEEVVELGYFGYDSVILGRNIVELPDIKEWVNDVRSFKGAPRGPGLGMKGIPFMPLQ